MCACSVRKHIYSAVTCTVAVGQSAGQTQSPEELPAWWTESSCQLSASVAGSLVERVWRPQY